MKKQGSKIILVLAISFFIVGCGGSGSERIRIGDLQSACDCVDAVETIADDIKHVVGNTTRYRDLNDRQRERVDELVTIFEMVENYCDRQFSYREARECRNFERVQDKIMALERIIF